MKKQLEQYEIDILKADEEGRAYLEYNDKVGGEPLGLFVPFGYPPGVEERGGVIAVYKECIQKGVPWETLLNFKMDDEVLI